MWTVGAHYERNVMHVYQCAECGSWHEGAAYHSKSAPRDVHGLLDRSYRDDPSTPRYCSEACRDAGDAKAAS